MDYAQNPLDRLKQKAYHRTSKIFANFITPNSIIQKLASYGNGYFRKPN